MAFDTLPKKDVHLPNGISCARIKKYSQHSIRKVYVVLFHGNRSCFGPNHHR